MPTPYAIRDSIAYGVVALLDYSSSGICDGNRW